MTNILSKQFNLKEETMVKPIYTLSVKEFFGVLDAYTDNIRNQLEQTRSSEKVEYIRGLKGLANHLGISISAAKRMKDEGQFKYYQAGRLVLFNKQEVDDTMAQTMADKKRTKRR